MMPGRRVAGLQGPWKINVDGDSNTAQANNWFLQLTALLTTYPVTIGTNFATSGNRWADLQARQATVNAAANGTRNCLLLACGINNIDPDLMTGAQVLAAAQTYLNGVSTNYEKIGLVWLPPYSGDGTKDGHVNTCNAGLASLQRCDFVVSREGITNLSNSLNTTYFTDVKHYNATGHAILARLAKQSLDANL